MEPSLSRSALRPFELLEAFRTAGRPLSLSEMSRLANIPISTCHSVVKSLEQYGYLYFISSREVYPTRRLWELAHDINKNDPITTRLAPALTSLRDASGETVILGIRQGDQVVYLLVVESTQTIRYSSKAGVFKPMHSSAIGKAFLGAMKSAQLDEWLAAQSFERVTEKTIVSAQELAKDLAKSRERGYYVTCGENVADVMAIATTFTLGPLRLGLALAGPLGRMKQNEAEMAEKLRACVAALEKRTDEIGQP